jgi:hypothetical protein
MLSMAIAVGQPRADHTGQRVGVQARKRPADGGRGRDGQAAGGLLAGAEHNPDLLGRISGPFGDRGDRPRPCQHRRGGQSQDGDQPVAAATGSSWVGDAGQIGQQVWGFGVVELAGAVWVSWVSAAGIGDDGVAGTGVRPGHKALRTHDRGRSCLHAHHPALRHEHDRLTERRSPGLPHDLRPLANEGKRPSCTSLTLRVSL